MSQRRNKTKAVEILEEVSTSTIDYLSVLRDPVSGRYAAPVPENLDRIVEEFHDSVKVLKKESYMESPGALEEDFERAWPSIWTAMQEYFSAEEWPIKYFAILDTGFMSDHPLLNGLEAIS